MNNTTHKEEILDGLKSFLRIPSVSAKDEHKSDIEAAADFLCAQLLQAGMDRTEKYYCGGNPIVFSEIFFNEHLPTVLIYGHYDVQPAEPLELWESPPFAPEIREGKIYARGACDDKAQVFLVIKAIENMIDQHESLCNIKLMIEGEEETGSGSLEKFIRENSSMLNADSCLVCDTSMPSETEPVLITGLRGICYWELDLRTGISDLHSGMHGGIALNAGNVLCELIAKMKNAQGDILIPGYYEGMKSMNTIGLTSEEKVSDFPSLDVNGLDCGYQDEGPKTVIPAFAKAKISSRLAPGQSHQHVHDCMENFIRQNIPEGTGFQLKKLTGCNAVRTSVDSPEYKSASFALENVFGNQPVSKRIGGTIPVVSMVQEILGLNALLMGFGLEDDNIHAPNECFSINNFFKGISTLQLFFKSYAETFVKQSTENLITQ